MLQAPSASYSWTSIGAKLGALDCRSPPGAGDAPLSLANQHPIDRYGNCDAATDGGGIELLYRRIAMVKLLCSPVGVVERLMAGDFFGTRWR